MWNPGNSLEIFPNTCRHNIFESYLGCWGCLLAVNLLIYLETSSLQQVNNISKLPGVLRLMLWKTGKPQCKKLCHWCISRAHCCWKSKLCSLFKITLWSNKEVKVFHSFIHSFIHSINHSFIHSFIHSRTNHNPWNWWWECNSLFYRVLALREECCVLWRITPYTFITLSKMKIFFRNDSVHEW